MEDRRKELVVIGDIAIDITLKIEHHEELNRDLVFRSLRLTVGGIAANVALQVSKLGHIPRFWTIVGTDPFGGFLIQELERSDLDAHVNVIEGNTTRNLIIVHPTGERTIFSDIGAHVMLTEDHCVDDSIRRAHYLYIPAFPQYWPLINKFHDLGPCIVSDFGFLETVSDLSDYATHIAPKVDIAFLSGARFDNAITEKMESEFLDAGCEAVFTTLGNRGVRGATKYHRTCFPAFSVGAVDTSGAGDSFAAGVLVGLLEGKDLDNCVRLGQATAAMRVTLFADLPNRDTVLTFLSQESRLSEDDVS